MKKVLLFFVVSVLFVALTSAQTDSTFHYTGGFQYFKVPCGVDSVLLKVWGAQGATGETGGNSAIGGVGGLGGYVEAKIAVSVGDTLFINVGGQGAVSAGGYNGGGNGGIENSGGGGGASDIRFKDIGIMNRIIVAGGGGGGGHAGCENSNAAAGAGGLGGGGNGVNGTDSPTSGGFAGGGQGGQGSVGGLAGIGCIGFLGKPGISGDSIGTGGVGGEGQGCCCYSFPSVPGGGGGGGGFIGGGGGGAGSAGTINCSGNDKGAGGGGAGGSSYIAPEANDTIFIQGIQSGDGIVIIQFSVKPAPLTISVSPNDTVCSGDAITLTGSGMETLSWNQGVSNEVEFVPLITSTYKLTGIDSHGCKSEDSIKVVLVNCTKITNNVQNAGIINIFPNPSNGKFTITSKVGLGIITVYNALGEIVFKKQTSESLYNVDISGHSNGIYLIECLNDDNTKSFIRIIKE